MEKWSKNEINDCIKLLKNGLTYDEIGKIVNRSPGSIRSKLFKLNIKFRDEQKIIRKCIFCNIEFNVNRKSNKKYCSNSCSMKHYNSLKNNKIINICINCGKETKNEKYCSNKCQGEHTKKLIYEQIENGDTTFGEKIYKDYLILKYGNKCMECGWNEINPITGKVPIQLEHISGNSYDNSLDNLKLLCPNCHSLTPTFGSLNKGNGRKKRREKRQEEKNILNQMVG